MENIFIEKLFMNVCMDLWSGDVAISLDVFKKTVNEYITNLKSYLGRDAHIRLANLGVKDETCLSWEEQDEQCKKQIREYETLLDYLNDDSNWTP